MTTAIALFLGNLFPKKEAASATTSGRLQPEFELYLPLESEAMDGAQELELLRRGTYEECDDYIQSNYELKRRRDELLMRSTGKLIFAS